MLCPSINPAGYGLALGPEPKIRHPSPRRTLRSFLPHRAQTALEIAPNVV